MSRSHQAGDFQDRAGFTLPVRRQPDRDRNSGAEAVRRREAVPDFKLFEPSAEERKRRWASFGLGSALQTLAGAAFLWLAFVLPSTEPLNSAHDWSANVILLMPVLPKTLQRPIALPAPRPQTRHVQPPSTPVVEKPKLVAPKPVAPPVVARARFPRPGPPELHPVAPRTEVAKITVPKWKPKVQVGAFSSASPAVARLNLPASRVQTGGFGSPAGVPGQAQPGSHPNVVHLGAFNLPPGAGSGNGSAAAQGARGTIASAGFGSALNSAPARASRNGGQVESAGFADAQTLTHPADQPQTRKAAPAFDPVEILSKPKPVYTREARRLHIQGEVLLRVVFAASGRLQVLGVTRGLGHGLDQAAIKAAQQIRFKPARRNGEPVSITATLHILFELAA